MISFSANALKISNSELYTQLKEAESNYRKGEFRTALNEYQKLLAEADADSIQLFKKMAFSYAHIEKTNETIFYLKKYINSSLDFLVINHNNFDSIRSNEAFIELSDKYCARINFWSILCLYVGFIGLFIGLLLNFKRRSDKVANFLISAFVLQHSLFIIHISFALSNYSYVFPNTLYMSTWASFLYGPLIYFYIKRQSLSYRFKLIDTLHLLPTLFIFILLIPTYILSDEDKLRVIITQNYPYMNLIIVTKLISLIVYWTLVLQLYFKAVKNNDYLTASVLKWQRNIVIFGSLYVLSYTVYAILIMQFVISGFLFYIQVGLMGTLVIYVGYTAFVNPSVFGRLKLVAASSSKNIDLIKKSEKSKYSKSGLTYNFSLELKEQLEHLLENQKIYRKNDLTLSELSDLLNTNRHNTSQVINEHFNLNFFELINLYRINEAKEIMLSIDQKKRPNIIDIAYEVGFNNKVTFNKSFKKITQITPTEYLKNFVA